MEFIRYSDPHKTSTVSRHELRFGDRLCIRTGRSCYHFHVLRAATGMGLLWGGTLPGPWLGWLLNDRLREDQPAVFVLRGNIRLRTSRIIPLGLLVQHRRSRPALMFGSSGR
jgi:hypothetical protein